MPVRRPSRSRALMALTLSSGARAYSPLTMTTALSPAQRSSHMDRELGIVLRTRSIDVFATLPETDIRTWAPVDEPSNNILDASNSVLRHRIDLERGPPGGDPFALVADQLVPFSDNIQRLVESDHPVLSTAAKHFFEKRHGKRFRPTIVALLSKALPIVNASAIEATRERQNRLGQITEMIHVASLIHDDVLDDAETRRGGDAIHVMYSNKVAVLSGDYLLARASVLLAKLQNVEVVEVMAKALDSLVSGEIMQIKSTNAASKKSDADGDETESSSGSKRASMFARAQSALLLGKKKRSALSASALLERDTLEMELYLRKSYYKTASLICDASKSCALLAGHGFDSTVAVAAEEYGYHLGLAFQIIDDCLDFGESSEDLGKPAGADLALGLATAPILYAAQEHPEQLRPLVERRFKGDGDVQLAYKLVRESQGLDLARKLARFHAQCAVDAVCRAAPHSEARDALISVAYLALTRSK